jgi:hypothetical protein
MKTFELTCRLELQPVAVVPCTHRYSPESSRVPLTRNLDWVRCRDCGTWSLEVHNPDRERGVLLRSKGWRQVADFWYLPDDFNGLLTIDEAYAVEMAK